MPVETSPVIANPSAPVSQQTSPQPTSSALDPLAVAAVTIHRRDGTTTTLIVEMASTPSAQEIGLSHRESLAPDHGMLFIFPADDQVEFWMRNTTIPLAIAFIRADGRIVDIQHMQPLSDDRHGIAEPYRYALETNQNYFSVARVVSGDLIDLTNLGRP